MTVEERHEIMEVKSFVDAKGREVRQFTQMYGKNKDASFYKGVAMAVIRQQNPMGINAPPMTRPFEFVMPEATGLKKAFEIFDVEAKKALNEIQKMENERMAANKVVPAGAMPTILGPTGKKA